jgi:hypothetical protein
MIDEVHLLNDKTRGHTLEAVIARMKMTIAKVFQNRFYRLRIRSYFTYFNRKTRSDLSLFLPQFQMQRILPPGFLTQSKFKTLILQLFKIQYFLTFKFRPSDASICHNFGPELRPVPLRKVVLGFPFDGKSHFKFEMNLNYRLNPRP